MAQTSQGPAADPFGYPGATPVISSNGETNALVWALETDAFATSGPAILHCYDATDVSNELYDSSSQNGRGDAGPAVKFAVPTVVNGKVYVGTQTGMTVYGLLSAPISGTLTLQGRTNMAVPLTFTFRPATGSPFAMSVTPAANGQFTLPSAPRGDYTLAIQGSVYLRKDVAVDNRAGAVTNLTATLLAGDINGDNVVNLQDFSLLAAAYGSSAGSANWNPSADLNGDGVVDLQDFELLAANYGLSGDP
jgi:outer membrane protein assembly factor BamB